MAVSERKSPVRRGRWLLRTLVALVVIGALGGLVVWGFIEGRGEAALEAERERPVKAPSRVSLDGHGEPFVTLDAETRRQSGVVITPQGTPYQDEVRVAVPGNFKISRGLWYRHPRNGRLISFGLQLVAAE
jgi:hypothetical protein